MAETPARPPVFPYRYIWEEIDYETVRFATLEERRRDFELLAEINVGLELKVPNIERAELETLVAPLRLAPTISVRLVNQLELAVGWYLAFQIRRKLGQDSKSVRRLLGKVAEDARRLVDSLSELDPRTAAVLNLLLPLEPDALKPNEPLVLGELLNRVHDVALVTQRAASDMSVSSGRPADYVRNSMLALLMEAAAEATGEAVTMSRGTNDRPEPHFTNPGGRLIRTVFAKLGLMQESVLAQAAERIRRTSEP